MCATYVDCLLGRHKKMMIAPNSRARKGVKGEYGIIGGEKEGNTDYGEWCNLVSKGLCKRC